MANGSRGTITALDPQARTLTIRLDGSGDRMVTLPRSYLDGRGCGERNRRVDLAYATTGHRAQGLTRGRALVRLTGTEDVNWLYVQLSRARQDTRLYAVVGPEPQGAGELDLPEREQPDGYLQLAQALFRAGGQTLAIDTPSSMDIGQLSTAELRAERDRLRGQLDQAPRDRRRELTRASAHRRQAEAALAAQEPATGRQPTGMLRWLRRADRPASIPGALAVATQQVNRAHDRERELRQHQQRRDGWLEANAHLGRSIGRWCGPWPGGGERPGWPSKPTGPAMSWRRWGRCPSRPGAGGSGARPPPRSKTTGAATRSPIPTGPSDPSPTTQPSGPPGSGRARPSSASRPSNAAATATSASRPASATTSRDLASGVAGTARSGPPASASRKEYP